MLHKTLIDLYRYGINIKHAYKAGGVMIKKWIRYTIIIIILNPLFSLPGGGQSDNRPGVTRVNITLLNISGNNIEMKR